MLRRLRLENFKSWKSANLEFGKITGLFGTNSSGKTALHQFLLLLKQTKESTDRTEPFNFGDTNTYANLGTFRDAIFEHNTEARLRWALRWRLESRLNLSNPLSRRKSPFLRGNEIRVGSTIQDLGKQQLSVQSLTYKFADVSFSLRRSESAPSEYALSAKTEGESGSFRFIRVKGRPWKLPGPVKCYAFPDQVRTYYQNAVFLSDLELEFEKKLDQIFYLGPLREFPKREYLWAGSRPADVGRRGERAIDALIYARSKRMSIGRGRGRPRMTVEEYVAHWLKDLGLIHEFSVDEIAPQSNLFRVKVRKTPSSPDALITDVGFGVSQVLPVLVLLYYAPNGSTVILEQPEIHLHPSVQSGLADVLVDAMKVKNLQIIFESHSEHLLLRLQRRIAEEEIGANDVKLYFTEVEKGESKLEFLDIDMFGNIRNWPKNFFGDEFGEMASMQLAAQKRRDAISQ